MATINRRVTPMGRLVTRNPQPRRVSPFWAPSAPGVASRTRPGTVPARTTPRRTVIRPPGAPIRNVTVNAPQPRFNPGSVTLDPEAQAAIGAANARYLQLTGIDPSGNQVGQGQYAWERDRDIRDIGLERAQTTLNRDNQWKQANSNAASRGIFNSSIRLNNRADIAAAAQMMFDQLSGRETDALDTYRMNMANALSDWQQEKTGITGTNQSRAYQNFLANQTVLGPKDFKVYSYPQWLAYHASAKTKGFPTTDAERRKRYAAYVSAHTRY